MITRILLASAPIVAVSNDAGALQTVKNVALILFLVIGAAWLFIDIRRNLIAAYGEEEARPARVAAPAPAPVQIQSEGIPNSVVAAIAAAVHATLGATSRVVEISSSDDDSGLVWAAEGRRAIYATRKLR